MKRLLVASLLLCALPCQAEQIHLHDGTVVKGELVDFQNGVYTVKVGKFLKTIPEGRISDVRPDGAAAPATSAAAAAPAGRPAAAAPALPGARPPMAQPIYGPNAGALSSGVPGAGPALKMIQGMTGGQQINPAAVNEALKNMGAADPGISQAVQQMMSGGGIDMGQLQQLQNNPAMQKMVERFRDPAYQRSLIEGLKEVQGQEGGAANPMLDQLQGLFQQLNTLQGQPAR